MEVDIRQYDLHKVTMEPVDRRRLLRLEVRRGRRHTRCNEMIRLETRRHRVRACADVRAGLTAGSLPLISYFLISTHTLDIS